MHEKQKMHHLQRFCEIIDFLLEAIWCHCKTIDYNLEELV